MCAVRHTGHARQYLEGISVSEDTLAKPNPLLVINNRLTLNAPPVRVGAPRIVLEANHLVATGRAVIAGGPHR